MEVVPHQLYRPEMSEDVGFVSNVEEWSELNGTQQVRREFGRWLKPGGGQEYRQASDWCRTELSDGERTQRRSCEVFSSEDTGKKMQVLRAQQQWAEVRGTSGSSSARTVHVSRQVQAMASSATNRTLTTKVTRTSTSTASSSIAAHLGRLSEDTFGPLQLALNQLDHSTQKLKGSVGRMGAIGSRRPPSRLHRMSSGTFLDANMTREEPSEEPSPSVLLRASPSPSSPSPSPPPLPPPLPPSPAPSLQQPSDAPLRGRSRSTDDLPLEEPAWKREVKLRRSLRLAAARLPVEEEIVPVEVERRPSRVSAFNVRETIEQRRRSLQLQNQQRKASDTVVDSTANDMSAGVEDKEAVKKKSEEWWERRKSYGFESAESWRRRCESTDSDSRRHSTGSSIDAPQTPTDEAVDESPRKRTVITLGGSSSTEKSLSASDLVQEVEAEATSEKSDLNSPWRRESKERRSLRESNKSIEERLSEMERTYFRCAMMPSDVPPRKPVVITIPIRLEEEVSNGPKASSPPLEEKAKSEMLGKKLEGNASEGAAFHSKTWISNGKVSVLPPKAEEVHPDSTEDTAQQQLKQKKKVEFSKMEVHFSAESGRFNIVESSEDKPPSNLFRRRRKEKYNNEKKMELRVGGDVQETRFGDSPYEKWLLGKTEDGEENGGYSSKNSPSLADSAQNSPRDDDSNVIHHPWGVQLRRVNNSPPERTSDRCEPFWKTSVKLKPLDDSSGTKTDVHKDEMRLQQLVRSLRPTGSPLLQSHRELASPSSSSPAQDGTGSWGRKTEENQTEVIDTDDLDIRRNVNNVKKCHQHHSLKDWGQTDYNNFVEKHKTVHSYFEKDKLDHGQAAHPSPKSTSLPRTPFRVDPEFRTEFEGKQNSHRSSMNSRNQVSENPEVDIFVSSLPPVTHIRSHSEQLHHTSKYAYINDPRTNSYPHPESHPKRNSSPSRIKEVHSFRKQTSNHVASSHHGPSRTSASPPSDKILENTQRKCKKHDSKDSWGKGYTEDYNNSSQLSPNLDATSMSKSLASDLSSANSDAGQSLERHIKLRSSFQEKSRNHPIPVDSCPAVTSKDATQEEGVSNCGSGYRSIVGRLKERLKEQYSPLHRDQAASSSSGSKTDWIYFEPPKRSKKKDEGRSVVATKPLKDPPKSPESLSVPNRKAKLSLDNIMKIPESNPHHHHRSDSDSCDELTQAANTILEAVAGYTDCSSQPQSEDECGRNNSSKRSTLRLSRAKDSYKNHRNSRLMMTSGSKLAKSSSESMASDRSSLDVPVTRNKKLTKKQKGMKDITEEEPKSRKPAIIEHQAVVKRISTSKVARHAAHTHSSAQKAKPSLRQQTKEKESSSSDLSTPSGSLSKTTGAKRLMVASAALNRKNPPAAALPQLDKVEEGVEKGLKGKVKSSRAPVAVKESGHYVAQVNTKKRSHVVNNHRGHSKPESGSKQQKKVQGKMKSHTRDESSKATSSSSSKAHQKNKTANDITAYI